ncbi:MAG: nucleotidyltransferase family protein [Lachnospiraceae bacterium]|nr:nucleotidyltransferase family protein [Lachnospiraceae bacterium]
MQICGIIAEYNPLHLGHQYHITQTKALTGADYIVTVLSGDFVQRGLPAILDKHTRTRMALEAGSDLVLELPVSYALSSGEGFGFGAVSLLHQLGCVNTLSFGTEAGALDKLKEIARVLNSEQISLASDISPAKTAFFKPLQTVCSISAYHRTYQTALKQGLTHPAARTYALQQAYPGLDLSVLDSMSNNMLALEYLKALYRLDSSIQPVTIKRQGQAYLDTCPGDFSSATAIRECLEASDTCPDLSEMVPAFTVTALKEGFTKNRLIFPGDFNNLLHYKLLSLPPESLTDFWEVTTEFANKISKHLPAFTDFTQFANLLWTKDTTYARVCRTLMHILLDIKTDTHDVHKPVPYARILGFRRASAPLLSEIKKKTDIPLISKLADCEAQLMPEAYQLLNLDIKAAHIYDSVLQQKSGIKTTHEMQKQIIML